MSNIIKSIEDKFKKAVIDVRPGDTVRVNQRIQEGNKTRVQMFEGLVIRVSRKNSLSYRILVRKVASGVGVEKSFLMHAPNVEKVEVVKRSEVRRNYLTYMRERSGKSARLASIDFDKDGVNALPEEEKVEAPAEPEAEVAAESQAEKEVAAEKQEA
jgi:large subunit ribosomal protein L19